MATNINSTKKLSITSEKKANIEQDPAPSKGTATPFWGQTCHHVKALRWLTTARSSTCLHRYIPYPTGFCFGLFQIITACCSGDTLCLSLGRADLIHAKEQLRRLMYSSSLGITNAEGCVRT